MGEKGQAHMASSYPNNEGSLNPMAKFKREEIEKLKAFLWSLEKPSEGTCSLEFSGISSSSCVTISRIKFLQICGLWIQELLTIRQVMEKSFTLYTHCSSHKKITIDDGSVITVAGRGDVFVNSSLILKNVFHVPKLFANLCLIEKLTKDSNCSVMFFPFYCVIQEQGTKRTIGCASERDGFYYFDEQGGRTRVEISSLSSFLSESVISIKDRIWLYHRRLGHPSFRILKGYVSFFVQTRVCS